MAAHLANIFYYKRRKCSLSDEYKYGHALGKLNDWVYSMDDTIFRAYDIRGIYQETLTESAAQLIGQSIGSTVLASGQKRIAIARDGRDSGPALRDALSEGIRASGCDVVDVGWCLPLRCISLPTISVI